MNDVLDALGRQMETSFLSLVKDFEEEGDREREVKRKNTEFGGGVFLPRPRWCGTRVAKVG